MSQVVTRDHRQDKKFDQTCKQEKNITIHPNPPTWILSDATKTLMIERIIALISAPLWLFFLAIFVVMSLGVCLCLALFRLLSLMFIWQNKKNP